MIDRLGERILIGDPPLQRLGETRNLEDAAVMFASMTGKHITGQILADGGVSVV